MHGSYHQPDDAVSDNACVRLLLDRQSTRRYVRHEAGGTAKLDEIVKEFPEDADTDEDDDIPKIAVVGKPNVGKSSLINKLLGEDRVIVSDIAGTTRDAVDAKVKWKDREYIFIDTAGLRARSTPNTYMPTTTTAPSINCMICAME